MIGCLGFLAFWGWVMATLWMVGHFALPTWLGWMIWIAGMVVGVFAFFLLESIANLWDRCSHGVARDLRGDRHCSACDAELEAKRRREAEEKAEAERERATIEEARRKEREERRFAESRRLQDLSYLSTIDPIYFEKIVHELYRRKGWQVEETPVTGDGGIDGYMRRDGIVALLQCKRLSTGAVGARDVRDLLGAVAIENACRGILVTTTRFTNDAMAWASRSDQLELIDGRQLIDEIRKCFPKDSPVPKDFEIARHAGQFIPRTCPVCGAKTRTVSGRHGLFLGCSTYPKCHWTLDLPNEVTAKTSRKPKRSRRSSRRRRW